MQRLGSRGVTADVTRSLAVQLTPTLLSPSCLEAVMQLALSVPAADSDMAADDTAPQLLCAISHAAPSLFVNAGPQVMGRSAASILTDSSTAHTLQHE